MAKSFSDQTPDPAAQQPPLPEHAALIGSLFHEHNETLVRFLSSRLQSRQEAMEIAQEAYVRLLKLDQPGAVSYMRAFLFKTATNLASDRLRARHRELHAVRARLFDQFTEALTPERQVAGTQEVGLLNRLIQELPPKCRQIFLLQRFQGLRFDEIAMRMEISERMVRKHVVRALTYLRAGLQAAKQEPSHD